MVSKLVVNGYQVLATNIVYSKFVSKRLIKTFRI